jgi:hypothetical protein
MSSEREKPHDQFAANRSFEQLTGINLSALREDQRGSYHAFKIEEFRRQRGREFISGPGEKLIPIITFNHEKKTVIVKRTYKTKPDTTNPQK